MWPILNRQIMGEKVKFATKLGVIASTVGAAVGLGNIWRFPYETGMNGGAAFLIVYILCVLVLGIPVMCAEFSLGHYSKNDSVGTFKKLAPGSLWRYTGYLGVLATTLILGYYMVISGWTLEYLFQAITGKLSRMTPEEITAEQTSFIQSDFRPLLWVLIFLIINYVILVKGVQKGIEKMSNILMPMLFIILIIFCVRSFFLPGRDEGLAFFLNPDFSKITPQVVIRAMGQAFFSLSLGMGTLITYSSYFGNKTRLVKTAGTVALLDTTVAILAGIIIFPAVFSYGLSPTVGTELVFVTLPNVFNQLPAPALWSSLFFILLVVAALTSTVSLFEVSIAFLIDHFHLTRKRATLLSLSVVALLSTVCSLSQGAWSHILICGKNLFDACDYLSAIILLPLSGLLISLFAGWKLDTHTLRRELIHDKSGERLFPILYFCIKYLAPIIIIFIFLSQLFGFN